MRSPRLYRALGILVALGFSAAPAAAQSLFGSGGLGVPVDAVGARARALGSVGVGVRGPELHPLDPAAAADFPLPLINLTMVSTTATFAVGDRTGETSGQRFPVLGILFPIADYGNFFASFSSAYDLRWGTRVVSRIELGPDLGRARVIDQFASDGGVSALRVGWSRRFAGRFSVGVSGGPYLGEVVRSFARTFDSTNVSGPVEPTVEQGAWDFSGWTGTLGVAAELGSSVYLSGSVTSSSSLDATPRAPTVGEKLSFDLPMELRLGGTVNLIPELVAVGSVELSEYDEVLGGSETIETRGRTLDYGAGLEWTGTTLAGNTFPIRLGYGRRELPFALAQGLGEESYLSVGAGIDFVFVQNTPLARLDVSVERGDRTAPGIAEDFWRMGLSLRISGR